MAKGEFNGTCNITACTTGRSATWYNHSTRAYYCPDCASRLNNDPFNKRDAARMFGHDLCTDAEHKLPKKGLTVKNPWAWLIAQGIKDIENRTWRTNFRGRVLIHASVQPDHSFTRGLFIDRAKFSTLNHGQLLYLNRPKGYTNSEILCSVEIVDCVMDHPSIWAESGRTEEDKQIWNWVLANPQPEPNFAGLKIKGALSFWDFTQERIIGKEVSDV